MLSSMLWFSFLFSNVVDASACVVAIIFAVADVVAIAVVVAAGVVHVVVVAVVAAIKDPSLMI